MEGCSSTDGETFSHYEPSPAHHHRRYHVFLSFEGLALRKTLLDHLFESLSTAGFQVFLDNERLEKEENIEVRLGEAVRDSTVYIPIFSADYASSACRLDELSLIWTCNSTCTGTTIIPLFYKVEPSDVRYQKGPYAKAFQKHSEEGRSEEKMDAWKKALHEISLLSGWSLAETAGGYEGRLVKLVVMDLLNTLKINSLYVTKHPEGLSDRTEEVIRLLEVNNHSLDVLVVGIWGMGGLGKTTLAKAVYNNIHSKFQASCFVFDVRASTKESVKGLLELQKQILRDLVKVDESTLEKLNSVCNAKIQMENCLKSIKALVILDDVDDEEQLDALVGDALKGYWFRPGSRIIITTRDSEVLARQIHVIQYRMRGLNPKEGLKLFCWHAFMTTAPAEGYADITDKIVDACQGLPLSLEVVGAHLYGEKVLEIWREALKNLLNFKNKKVYNSLKISYDALSCEEQRMFLDIACFFLGPLYFPSTRYNMDFYVKLWRDLKCRSPRTYLRNLERKSLIRIDENRGYSIFWMHDHLRDLGRQIVEEESPNNQPSRSRLWCHEDIVTVTAQTQGISNVEGLVLNFRDHQTYRSTYRWAFMLNLKFMFIEALCQEGRTTLPPNLIWLGLWNCRFQEDGSASETQPISFNLPKTIGQLKFLRFLDMSGRWEVHLPNEIGELFNLEELYLSQCRLQELPQSLGNLIKLKVLDVSKNCFLKELSALPSSLIELNLYSCAKLTKLPSLDFMHSLKDLRLESCEKLQELPALPDNFSSLSLRGCYKLQEVSSISHLKKLEVLDVSGCTSLTKLPSLDSMHSLKNLKLESCVELQELAALPNSFSCRGLSGSKKLQEVSSISHLKKMEVLDVSRCLSLTKLPSLESMHSLKDLKLESCVELQELPALPHNFSCLRLSGCYKMQEVSSISHLKKLEVLDVSQCTSLRKLPSLDSMHSLKDLKLDSCEDLQELPALPDSLRCLSLRGCHKLQEVSSISHLKKMEVLDVSWCKILTKLPSLDSIHSLKDLKLHSCDDLQELPCLPESLVDLQVTACCNLRNLPSLSHMIELKAVDLSCCKNLTRLPQLSSMLCLRELKLDYCWKLKELPPLPKGVNLSRKGLIHLNESLESVVLSLGSPFLPLIADKGKRKNPEPGDITALSLALPNPKRLYVSEVNEEGRTADQEYMDRDGQGEASFPTPPAGNT